MAGWFKGLLGGGKKPAAKKTPAAKTAPNTRAALIAEALEIRAQARAHAQDVLEKTFQELQANPPPPSDVAAMTRLLSLRQAVLNMRSGVAQDPKRGKALAQGKGLLESPGKGNRPAAVAPDPKGSPRRPPSQGSKR